MYDLAGNLLDDRRAGGISVGGEGVLTGVLHPTVPAATARPVRAQTYFVELLLRQHGQVLDRNVYWLSTQPDVLNWKSTLGSPQATMSQYADLTQLQTLPRAEIAVSATTRRRRGPDLADTVTDVTIRNTSSTATVAFFLRADLRRGTASGPGPGDGVVLPTFWSDNDITLWPGESQTISVSYRRAALEGHSPSVTVSGYNVPARSVAAP